MASITSLGIGSGLDLNNLVSQLVSLQRQPLQQMDVNARKLQGQVSSYGQIKSLFSGLQDAANKLNNVSLWSAAVATSSNAATVGVVAGTNPAVGSYEVTVQKLAGGQTAASAAVFSAATDLVGAGTLTIERGSWNEAVNDFTAKIGATAVDVIVTATDTLADVRDKINAANGGVRASLVTDASGVRLALRSTETGAANGFRIGSSDADPGGIARLAFDPEAGIGGMGLMQAAVDARATVNGIVIVSASNELAGAIEGATLQLKAESATPVTLDVRTDTGSVKAAMKTFADAYSALARFITDQTRYDPGSKVSGPLQGDSSVSGMQQQLRQVMNTVSGASTKFPRMSDLGLELQRDGTLTINSTKLDAAVADLPELRKAMSGSDTLDPSNNGFARRYATLAQQVLAVDGSVSTRTDGLRKRITMIDDDKQRLNDRVDLFQQRLVAQYSAMDANVARLKSINDYVTQQLAAMSNSNRR